MNLRRFLITGLLSVIVVLMLSSAASATSPPTETVCTDGKCEYMDATATTISTPFTTTTTSTTTWKREITSYEKRTKRTIVVWWSTKRLVPKAGTKCYAVGRGTKYPWFWNSYRRASDGKQVWFKDTRRSTLCGTGKQAAKGKNLKRTACQNPSRLPTQPAPPKARILKKKNVREFRSIIQVKKFLLEQGTETRTTVTTGTTTSVKYSCPVGWTPIDGGKKCRKCEAPKCVEVPKDGSEGPGYGTPGQPGGCAAGHVWNGNQCVLNPDEPDQHPDPGDPDDGNVCRDPASGDIVTGRSDEMGYCLT